MYTDDMDRGEAAAWAAYYEDIAAVRPPTEQDRFDMEDCRRRVTELDSQ